MATYVVRKTLINIQINHSAGQLKLMTLYWYVKFSTNGANTVSDDPALIIEV